MSLLDSLDEVKLAAYLETRVADFKGPLQASKFPGGQSNPTFKIDAASGSYVLRRKPPGKLLKSAHAVDREFRVLQALAATDVPVARVYHLCADTDIMGSMFYLMEFCDGNIHWQPDLEKVSSNELRGQMYDEMNRVLAAIHCVNLEQHGLTDYGRPGNYFQRQFGRWSSQYQASEITSIGEMDRLMAWLGDNLPADDGKVALVHGDFRVDNLMYSPDNRRIIAVLDWELSTLGHPYADLAYQCMALRLPPPGPYSAVAGLKGIDRGALGIPTEEQYVAACCQRMGIDGIDNSNFYLAFRFFRLVAIAQGVAKRAADGNASSASANAVGAMVQPLAAIALDVVAP